MNAIQESVTRILRMQDKKFWFTAISIRSYLGGWGNCLYLHFAKEDFPELNYPKLVDSDWFQKGGKRFDYNDSFASQLDWHGGCTFYEEVIVVETGRTIVKVGCDYQHYGDDAYKADDSGAYILASESGNIAEQFERLVASLRASAPQAEEVKP